MYYELLGHIFKATEEPKQDCKGCIFYHFECAGYDLIINGVVSDTCTFEEMSFELVTCPREILLAKINKLNKIDFIDVNDGNKKNHLLLEELLKGQKNVL
ncbi:MAG: hypothetical protein ACRCW9_05910 [Cetobacterium sp.]